MPSQLVCSSPKIRWPRIWALLSLLIPIAPTIFWGPMAYAIMGGLAVATVLTLVFLPALYVIWFRIKSPQPDSIQKLDLPQTAIAQPLT